METLKFLHVTMNYPPAHFGGDARFVEYLSNELARAGHEVHVFHNPSVFELLRKKKAPDLDAVTQGGVRRHIHRPRMPRADTLVALNFGSSRSSVNQYERLLKEVKPDVVHWHNTKGFFAQPLRSDHAISLYTAHDYFAVCPRSHLLRPGYKICQQPFLCQTCLLRWRKPPQLWRTGSKRTLRFPKGTTIITPSNFMAGKLEQDGIITHHVLRNFVPDTKALVGERRPGKFLLYLGILEKQKGIFTLLDAFNKSRRSQDFELWIAGEGSMKGRIKTLVNGMNLSSRVRVPGFTPFEALAPILREAAAIVVPSENFENAPLAILEAFSSGVSVIGSDIGGLPELLYPESGSTVFPPGDANRLSEIMVDFWNQKDGLPEMGRLARAAYERDFLPEVHLRKYLDIVSGIRR